MNRMPSTAPHFFMVNTDKPPRLYKAPTIAVAALGLRSLERDPQSIAGESDDYFAETSNDRKDRDQGYSEMSCSAHRVHGYLSEPTSTSSGIVGCLRAASKAPASQTEPKTNRVSPSSNTQRQTDMNGHSGGATFTGMGFMSPTVLRAR